MAEIENESSPPSTLYHYTSLQGLLGILDTGTIRATAIRYLNDSKEFELSREWARKLITLLRTGDERDLDLDRMSNVIDKVSGGNTFVTSFSVHGDLLSQWRGYCPGGSGYSIGFDFSAIQSLAKDHDFRLAECIYVDRDELDKGKLDKGKEHPVRRLLEEGADELRDAWGTSEPGGRREAKEKFGGQLEKLAPTLKDDSFEEEQEWRLIYSERHFRRKKEVQFREGMGVPTPYVELGPEDALLKCISRLVVGPNANLSLAEEGATWLLSNHGIGAEVTTTNIPYRTS